MDPTNRINDLIVLTSHLADLLARENQALREQRLHDATALLEEKNTLSRALESRVEGLGKLAEGDRELDHVDPDLRERLHGLGEKVNAMVEENAKLLKVAIEANRLVVKAIAEAAKASRPGPGTYSANGAVDDKGSAGAARNVAISVDHQL